MDKSFTVEEGRLAAALKQIWGGRRCVGGLLCFSLDFLRIVSHSYKERAGSTSGCED